MDRVSSGNNELDAMLGGGFLPGTKAIVYGPTGVGKTILCVGIAHAGIAQDDHPGVIFDISRGMDAQNHLAYAQDLFGWNLSQEWQQDAATSPREMHNAAYRCSHNPFGDENGWEFRRHHFPRTRRILLDGSEPESQTSPSIATQFWKDLREKVNHHITGVVYKDDTIYPTRTRAYWEWVSQPDTIEWYRTRGIEVHSRFKLTRAPENERERFVELIKAHDVDEKWVSDKTVYREDLLGQGRPFPVNELDFHVPRDHYTHFLFQTSQQSSIYDLVNSDWKPGELDAQIATVIKMGFIPVGPGRSQRGRALAVTKHRGSWHDENIREFTIEKGLKVQP